MCYTGKQDIDTDETDSEDDDEDDNDDDDDDDYETPPGKKEQLLIEGLLLHFITARCSNASAVLGVVILSVRLSHECFLTNQKNLLAIFLYCMKGHSF